MGYCSVRYAAEWDQGTQRPYAVCDHRLDGEPIKWAISDHFGPTDTSLVSEVTVTSRPKLNVDYIAFKDDPTAEDGVDLIGIEAQTIDLRGGGVGPAWRAWENRDVESWRKYFSEEASRKGRRDTVDYGVNTGNVYKRLAPQVAVKGEFLKQVHVPFYVVMQWPVLQQLRARVNFHSTADGEEWDITFVGFDYTGHTECDGKLEFRFVECIRTTLYGYLEALTGSNSVSTPMRADLIEKVKRKAGMANIGTPAIEIPKTDGS
jgi:hypothetical protein